ncbi:Na+/H+ antiporter subunit D [Luteimicrobium album]|uniref:Na+/H+ antiporter subunit D n=1 Tax=Luteimicrobium album TaxID=1054550 RepID=A0ABQ6I0Q6_9MICO|nr:Na+/H+ antiporter subunit D [Luteimicrobium album]GMA24313.1 Na+/H+ antiporter subunit D [Luteimicrobium album]
MSWTDLTATDLVPLPVVLPLLAAGLALVFARRPRVQRVVSVVALAGVLAVGIALLVLTDDRTLVVDVGNWAAPIGIDLVADRLSALMVTVSSFVLLCVLLYSLAQGVSEEAEEETESIPVSIYHPTYLVLAAGVCNAFLAGDLFNLYVGFEILLAASYVLLTLGGTGERIRAGSIYVVVALLSSIVFLIAIALTYAATGTVNLAQLSERLPDVEPGTRLAIQLLLLLAFGIKAAMFPVSAWLPDSYPTAPAPVTAVFAGLLTKVGVYAILRTQTLLFPTDPRIDQGLMWVALLTMLVGILGAVAQDDIKRLLSFTLVSHIGYMLFGIALATQPGTAAAIFYVVHHITVQTALFLVVGLVELRGGSTSLDRLGGLAKLAPGLAILFFIPAMNLAGIPPLSGFLGKVGLVEDGVRTGGFLAYTLVVGSVVTSLLTLYAIVKAWNKAFWQEAPQEIETDARVPRGMVVPTGALVAFGLALTVFAGPLYSYADRAAAALRDGSYVEAVFPDGHDRGVGESNETIPKAGAPAGPASAVDTGEGTP